VFDWRAGTVEVHPADGGYDLALEATGWDYRVVAPVLPGAIAVLGDPALYACAGDRRVANVEVMADGLHVTVLGAGETVRVAGWSEGPLAATQWSAMSGATDLPVTRNVTTGAWNVDVVIGDAGWTKVLLRAG